MLRFVALLSVSLWGMFQAKRVLIPLILAAMLAFVLTPGVRFLRRHRVPEAIALIGAALVFIVPLAAIIYEAVLQGENLVHHFPSLVAGLSTELNRIASSHWAERFHLDQTLALPSLIDKLGHGFGADLEVALKGARAFLTAGGEMFLILVFALLMLANRERLEHSAELILRQGKSSSISEQPASFLDSIAKLIQRYLLVRLGIAALIGGVDFLILELFGLPYALFAGAFLGLMTIVPMVGFFIGVLPPLLLAIAGEFSMIRTISMLIALSVISIAESHILSPKLLGRHLNLNLLFTFLGLFVGESLWGGWGMFLIIPILGIVRIILASTQNGLPWSQLLAQKENQKNKT